MTVRIATVDGRTVVELRDACPVGEAEVLCAALQGASSPVVDLEGAGPLHTAVIQVLLAFKPDLRGAPAGAFLQDHVLTALS